MGSLQSSPLTALTAEEAIYTTEVQKQAEKVDSATRNLN